MAKLPLSNPAKDVLYEYSQTAGGDGFWLRTQTEATNNTENLESQSRCGITVTDPDYYYVCAF